MSDDEVDRTEQRWRQQHAEPPARALAWGTSDERKRLLARWRDAIGNRASRFQIKLAWVIRDNLNWNGSTSIGDLKLMNATGCSRRKVQVGLPKGADKPIQVPALIGLYRDVRTDAPRAIWRRALTPDGRALQPARRRRPRTSPSESSPQGIGRIPTLPFRSAWFRPWPTASIAWLMSTTSPQPETTNAAGSNAGYRTYRQQLSP
jgi:hypothetical protein